LRDTLDGDHSTKTVCFGNPDCAETSYTLAGDAALANLEDISETIMSDNVPGDFVEIGVWRGGMSIYARALQVVHNQSDSRRVYACDSYSGLPKSTTDSNATKWEEEHWMQVSVDQVVGNFKRFHMMDDNVRFVKGHFVNTLPVLRAHLQDEGRKISILRGDLFVFEGYDDILYNLYEFVPVGGYFICDDCDTFEEANQAVHRFRSRHGITEEMVHANGTFGVTFWRKEKAVPVDYAYYLEWNATRNLSRAAIVHDGTF
jgi:hypothetical protein